MVLLRKQTRNTDKDKLCVGPGSLPVGAPEDKFDKKDCGSIFRREDLVATTEKLTKGIISFQTPTCSPKFRLYFCFTNPDKRLGSSAASAFVSDRRTDTGPIGGPSTPTRPRSLYQEFNVP